MYQTWLSWCLSTRIHPPWWFCNGECKYALPRQSASVTVHSHVLGVRVFYRYIVSSPAVHPYQVLLPTFIDDQTCFAVVNRFQPSGGLWSWALLHIQYFRVLTEGQTWTEAFIFLVSLRCQEPEDKQVRKLWPWFSSTKTPTASRVPFDFGDQSILPMDKKSTIARRLCAAVCATLSDVFLGGVRITIEVEWGS